MKKPKTLDEFGLPLAFCTFYLKHGKWTPLGVNTEATAKHRSDQKGDVIECNVTAAINGSKVVAWSKPGFLCRRVLKNGSVEPLDLKRVIDVMEADDRDAIFEAKGAVGINVKLYNRKIYPQDWQPTKELLQSVFVVASELIARKAGGGRPTGITITDRHL